MNTTEPARIYQRRLEGGCMWSQIIGRYKTLRLTDLEGNANVSMLLYHAHERQERYNMPDTLKGQHVFYLTHPLCMHSDMGRLFCSITQDTAGWHDTVCGVSDKKQIEEKYGIRTFQDARNDFYKDGLSCFLIELNKWGLGQKDLVPNLNLFSKVLSDEAGKLEYVSSPHPAGSTIDLRFEMDTLVVLNTCPHPMDPATEYAPGPIEIECFAAEEPDTDDPCYVSRPENTRAMENTKRYYDLFF